MGSVYTKRLGIGTFIVGSAFELDDVPDGFVWDVRDISIWTPGDGATAVGGFSAVVIPSAGPTTSLWTVQPALNGWPYHWQGRCLLNVLDILAVSTFDDFEWDVLITGYQLTLP